MDPVVASDQETLLEPAATARPPEPAETARPPEPAATAPRPRRQWGSDARIDPLPAVAPPASDAMMALGRIAIVFTILAWLSYVIAYFFNGIINRSYQNNSRFLWETIVYVGITSFLALSSLLYLVARQGALYRSRAHRRVPHAVIDDSFDTTLPTMTVLVPSYREEVPTVRKTLLSAALQEYPFLRVVLLLDDPPNPTSEEHKASLDGARQLSAELTAWLAEPRERFAATLEAFETSDFFDDESEEPTEAGMSTAAAQVEALAAEYDWAAGWLSMRAEEEIIVDHVDRFFADRVLGVLAADFTEVSSALMQALAEEAAIPRHRMLQLHRRLAWTFRGELTWFERKLYSSL